MARPGYSKAMNLLLETAEKHGIGKKDMLEKDRSAHIVRARMEFCARARYELKLAPMVIAQAIQRHHTTALYLSDAEFRERKRAHERRRRIHAYPVATHKR